MRKALPRPTAPHRPPSPFETLVVACVRTSSSRGGWIEFRARFVGVRSHPGRGRQRLRPRFALLLQQLGEQESELDRLLGIEARVPESVVAVVEILVADRARAAGAFGHV